MIKDRCVNVATWVFLLFAMPIWLVLRAFFIKGNY
jgi:hypothetical protein